MKPRHFSFFFFLFFTLSIMQRSVAQNLILNGSFEMNNASSLGYFSGCNDNELGAVVPNVFCLSGDLYLIPSGTSGCTGGNAGDGDWFMSEQLGEYSATFGFHL